MSGEAEAINLVITYVKNNDLSELIYKRKLMAIIYIYLGGTVV